MNRIVQIQTRIRPTRQITDYLIGSDLLGKLDKIPQLKSGSFSSFLLLSDSTIFKLFGDKVISSLKKLGKPVIVSLIAPGEKHKSLSAISGIVKPYFEAGFDRKSCLVALGGGVITDLGGFIASILLRGISAIYLPTTLLGQIDAAIGGKTGVDFQLSDDLMLKNMIGSIRQPSMVISDIDTLQTLPEKEILNGLGEMTKYWVGWNKPTPNQLSMVKKAMKTPRGWPAHSYAVAGGTPPMVEELVKTISLCQQIKLAIVQEDPFETKGLRQKLNLGHTIGHAIEAAVDGKQSHGQAVAIGLAAAALLSVKKEMLTKNTFKQIIKTIANLGLPTKITASQYSKTRLNLVSGVNKALKLDKKSGTFVLIEDIGNLVTGVSVKSRLVKEVISEVII